MPRRKFPLVNNEIYHVFNRSVAKEKIFSTDNDRGRFVNLIDFYRFSSNTIRYSTFTKLTHKAKSKYLDTLYLSNVQIEILAFCIMPNHFHFLLRQKGESGISNFMRLLQNGYAKYYNTKSDRHGALFQAPFKAKFIENQNLLIHTCRYIHLNPYSSGVINNFESLDSYPWTSFPDFITKTPRKFMNLEILDYFKNTEDFKRFTFDHAEYQKSLEILKSKRTPGV